METGDFSNENIERPATSGQISQLNLLTMFRLGLFQMGLGVMSLLTLGVLNRIMIDELAVPALVTAGAIAMHQFMAPARVWFGQMSDAKPFLGHHRTGYVWVGAALFAIAAFLAVQVMWQLGNSLQTVGWSFATYGWVGLLAFIFALYGLALSASSTPFAALLVDVSDEGNRSKLVGIVWSMLMVGIVIGAIVISIVLKPLAIDAPLAAVQASINWVFIVIPAIVFGLALLATVGVEKKYSCYASRSSLSDREDSITLGRAIKILTANRQTGLFFTFLLVMTISLFMQEPVLEPYGAQVFGMQISETTKLNAFWGMGTLIGISSTGFLVVPRLGKQRTTRWGCLLVALSVILIILAGFSQNAKLLQGVLFVFGLASGITTTGAISLMLDLTAAETAGTFIGAWGLSQAMARALATVTGGAVLSLGKTLFSNLVLAYGLVFAMQSLGMLLAVWFLGRVNVQEFRTNAKQAIATILEGELD
jgi:BCD family chlorophyll transporter-like MFS transporter